MTTESTREVPSVVDSNPQASAKNLKKVTAQVVAAARVALEIQDDSITADTTFLAAFGSDSLGQPVSTNSPVSTIFVFPVAGFLSASTKIVE